MERDLGGEQPLRNYFSETIHEALTKELGLETATDVENYLGDMLLRFLHLDRIYGLRDAYGQRVETVAEMVVEADPRLKAGSFDREREVHKHIGDFLLFWSGVFPEFLRHLRSPASGDVLLDPLRQGQLSYYVASTFDYDPYTAEAVIFRKLSVDFERYSYGLRTVRKHFGGLCA